LRPPQVFRGGGGGGGGGAAERAVAPRAAVASHLPMRASTHPPTASTGRTGASSPVISPSRPPGQLQQQQLLPGDRRGGAGWRPVA